MIALSAPAFTNRRKGYRPVRFHRPLLALALPLAALAARPASAQTVEPAVAIAPGNTLLTVSAEGTSRREPDLAVFSAGVTTQGPSAAEALGENARAMTRVIAALRRAGIAERDIQTSNLSINPVYADPERDAMNAARASGQPYVPPAPDPRGPRILFYQVSNSVSVRQRDLDSFGQVIDTLAAAGANQINGPAFQLDEPGPTLDEARLEAIATARQRAELYANATGLRVARIVSITEAGGHYAPPAIFVTAQRAGAPPPPTPMQPGELEMNASVTVLFELAPR
ncbi:MAG: SIMPL domain-containing protein [Porphyrobacter sp.]|nr:SIMPL domain-containing protein [Porphyrobacter sp.]